MIALRSLAFTRSRRPVPARRFGTDPAVGGNQSTQDGTFLERDPVSTGSWRYGYALNQPTGFVDPAGLADKPCCRAVMSELEQAMDIAQFRMQQAAKRRDEQQKYVTYRRNVLRASKACLDVAQVAATVASVAGAAQLLVAAARAAAGIAVRSAAGYTARRAVTATLFQGGRRQALREGAQAARRAVREYGKDVATDWFRKRAYKEARGLAYRQLLRGLPGKASSWAVQNGAPSAISGLLTYQVAAIAREDLRPGYEEYVRRFTIAGHLLHSVEEGEEEARRQAEQLCCSPDIGVERSEDILMASSVLAHEAQDATMRMDKEYMRASREAEHGDELETFLLDYEYYNVRWQINLQVVTALSQAHGMLYRECPREE